MVQRPEIPVKTCRHLRRAAMGMNAAMFYDAQKKDHGLPHDPFKAIVAPRPIGWITSMSKSGAINLAPYSYFNGVNSRPPMVMFSSEGHKDSVSFIEETGEFVCSLATWDLREAMNMTSAPMPRGTNEMEKAGLEPAPSRLVKPPRVASLALRARMQAAADRADCAISTARRWIPTSFSARSSACTSTTVSSRTACSTPPP